MSKFNRPPKAGPQGRPEPYIGLWQRVIDEITLLTHRVLFKGALADGILVQVAGSPAPPAR